MNSEKCWCVDPDMKECKLELSWANAHWDDEMIEIHYNNIVDDRCSVTNYADGRPNGAN